ncbi:MAG TPA: type II toxin-antitoxin system VapC family toxin [Candidatus Acidoferrum sp.]|nr:type II toxin-antitoxin system VapC family toxin [Candidatus Acidoferrum sp.]
MAIFVVDASVALAWCFEDEASSWTDGLLERLRQGDQVMVPAHWPTEILNGLLVASRRKRIKAGQPALFWDELACLPIEVEPALTAIQAKTVLALGEKHRLTVYDAAYLELAQRRQLPLGTLDTDLRKAAQAEDVILL